MTKRRGWLKGIGLLPRDRAAVGRQTPFSSTASVWRVTETANKQVRCQIVRLHSDPLTQWFADSPAHPERWLRLTSRRFLRGKCVLRPVLDRVLADDGGRLRWRIR